MAKFSDNTRSLSRHGFSVSEAAESIGCSKAFLYREWQRGRGPRRAKIGDRVIIAPDWVAEYISENEVSEG